MRVLRPPPVLLLEQQLLLRLLLLLPLVVGLMLLALRQPQLLLLYPSQPRLTRPKARMLALPREPPEVEAHALLGFESCRRELPLLSPRQAPLLSPR